MANATEVFVVVATKGRPEAAAGLIGAMRRQTLRPRAILMVGTVAADLPPATQTDGVEAWLAPTAGLTIQRNEAIKRLRQRDQLGPGALVVFFDDDFRPADDWLELCATTMARHPDIVGMTGQVLADGVHGPAFDKADALAYLSGARPPEPHWASGEQRETRSVYGCNMAFTGAVLLACLFDEALPLYGWQEDRDMTGQARRLGRVMFLPACRGVHLGSTGGRTSGVRLGYSQIANMIYLWRKGTVEPAIAARFIGKAFIANIARSLVAKRDVDHIGRLRGNLRAVGDLMRNRCTPGRILGL